MSSFAIETLLPSTEVVHSYAINLNPLSPGSLGPSRLTIVRQMIHVNGEDEPAEKRAVLVIEKNGTELWSKVLVRAIEVHGISGPPAEQVSDAMRCDAMRCDAMRCDAMRVNNLGWGGCYGGLAEMR